MNYLERIFKGLLIIGMTGLVVISTGKLSLAKVTGKCDNCHTMHSSQNGTAKDPHGALLKGNSSPCIGCHTGKTPTNGYSSTNVPQVDDPSGEFAAGTMVTITSPASWDGKHNVNATVTVANIPGYNSTASDRRFNNGLPTATFSCAGTSGCHGDRSIADEGASIHGGHHNSTAIGYRFLPGVTGEGPRATDADHPTPSRAWGYSNGTFTHQYGSGISGLCGECHGNFHTEVGAKATAWVRHPTDVLIPAEDRFETVASITEVPTGNMTAKTSPGNTVICQSCHYSHGSANPSILRFSYNTQVAGGGEATGCLSCHKGQR